jgi:hypothetical protein
MTARRREIEIHPHRPLRLSLLRSSTFHFFPLPKSVIGISDAKNLPAGS